ncbi:MAG: hypothetical protein KME27_27755 [Lyngbya sp. HA4199-MV5]|nr:hypothetical protein [Lyngbya sp. HA4199-MV5]
MHNDTRSSFWQQAGIGCSQTSPASSHNRHSIVKRITSPSPDLQPFSLAFTTPHTLHPYSQDCGLPNQ